MNTEVQNAIESLASDDPLVRRDAARALGEIGDGSAVEALIAALERPLPPSVEPTEPNHPEHTSRAAAAVALGAIGDPRAVAALLRASADSFNLGTAASTALGRLQPPPTELLLEATSSENMWRRARAASALGEIGDAVAFERLAALLGDAEDVVARAAASAFERLRDPRASGPLAELLSNRARTPFVRSYAAMALGALKDPATKPALVDALDEEDKLLRRAAARALCRFDDPALRPRLADLAASDPDPTLRQVVERYLNPRPGQRGH